MKKHKILSFMTKFFFTLIIVQILQGLGLGQIGQMKRILYAQSTTRSQHIDLRPYRRVSLDLKHRLPTSEEVQTILDQSEANNQSEANDQSVLNAWIDAQFKSSDQEWFAFVHQFFDDLLWPALRPNDLVNVALNLLLPSSIIEGNYGQNERRFVFLSAFYHRGAFVPCLDEPASYDALGALVFKEMPDGTRREGYVWVRPYWDMGQEIKVCALDAQLNNQTSMGISCDLVEGFASGECGCGENLERCASYESVQKIIDAFRVQNLEILNAYLSQIDSQSSIFQIFLQKKEPINGAIDFYYTHLAKYATDPLILESPVVQSLGLSFEDSSWHWVDQKSPLSSGILTSFPYLLRFQTARARANRFSTQFLCQPFIASSAVLPAADDPCSLEQNLRVKCGCQECHYRLEPLSAYFGRYSNAGALYQSTEKFPSYLSRCARCAQEQNCDDFCKKFYVSELSVDEQRPYLGTLKAYEWADDLSIDHIEKGPSAWVEESIEKGYLPLCMTIKVFERLMNRKYRTEEMTDLKRIRDEFKANGYDFVFLIKKIIQSKAYQFPNQPE